MQYNQQLKQSRSGDVQWQTSDPENCETGIIYLVNWIIVRGTASYNQALSVQALNSAHILAKRERQ
jgi:hypothetical protein